MRLLFQIGLVCLGSSAGGLARWGVGTASARWFGTAFPYGTFLINVTGSLFLGWFATVLSTRLSLEQTTWLRPDDLRLLVAVGFTGAYTTFSTYEYETYGLLRDGSNGLGSLYMFGSLFVGLIAVHAGVLLAKMS